MGRPRAARSGPRQYSPERSARYLVFDNVCGRSETDASLAASSPQRNPPESSEIPRRHAPLVSWVRRTLHGKTLRLECYLVYLTVDCMYLLEDFGVALFVP